MLSRFILILLPVLTLGAGQLRPFAAATARANELDDFYDSFKMYSVWIRNWNPEWTDPWVFGWEKEWGPAELEVYRADPHSASYCPDTERDLESLHRSKGFSVELSGNTTLHTPKASFKIKLAKDIEFLGQDGLTLKAMWNDPSQMREALAWMMFREAGVPAPRHTYAKFCINKKYYGLYSMIEQVDAHFVKEKFGTRQGNLYKGYSVPDDVGGATLKYRGDKGSDYYRLSKVDERTYRYKRTRKKSDERPELLTYDDLARFIQVINGKALSEESRSAKNPFDTDEYEEQVREILDVDSFIKWAALNNLVGAWDNYWDTANNFHLYNSGSMTEPRFAWIPWDYDLTFGSSFGNWRFQEGDLLNWGQPLVRFVLSNSSFREQYLNEVEDALDLFFNEEWVAEKTKRLFNHIWTAAKKESDFEWGPQHTGRQFSNHDVYWHGKKQKKIERWDSGLRSFGIVEYVRDRNRSARKQLSWLRAQEALAAK